MKKAIWFLFLFFLFPLSVLGYSDKVIVGGDTIGIEVHSDGVYVVGFYPVLGKNLAEEVGFQKGDIIKKVNQIEITSIEDLNNVLKKEENMDFEIIRNHKRFSLSLPLMIENGVLKTGLYVKDQINGIGTLSYIDPETKVFGSLGHEILENSSSTKFEIQTGNIYQAEVSSIQRSESGITGEKKATIQENQEQGTIISNETVGIFGNYDEDFSKREVLAVGTKEEIRRGKAIIRTVVHDQKIEDFAIQILAIDETSDSKNILFQITDSNLLEKTGGIVQGMSGSPIIQNDKIIGVVNYVIVDDARKGYGVFITTMLEEGDKTLS